LPGQLDDDSRCPVIVVDVLRATTSIAVAFAGGAREIVVCGSLRAARDAARKLGPRVLLCGETNSRRAKGFDLGNSPVEWQRTMLRGRTLVLVTTNGTRALRGVADGRAVFAGALVNRAAVLRAALAEGPGGVAVMCAGTERGTRLALEDVVVAGAYVELALTEGVEPADEALAALRLWQSCGGDALSAFREAAHGRHLEALGFRGDLELASQADVMNVAPRLRQTDGRLVL
jgi:2-phosphosulfolactate phosphatase